MSPRKKSTARMASLEKPMLLEHIAKLQVNEGALRMLLAVKNAKITHLEDVIKNMKEEAQMLQDVIENLTHQLEAKP